MIRQPFFNIFQGYSSGPDEFFSQNFLRKSLIIAQRT